MDDLEAMVNMEQLRDFCFDHSIEIIPSIFQYHKNEGKFF
jgi:hypothetical protein